MAKKTRRYSLVGVDGNAYAVMAYVKQALLDTGHDGMVREYLDRAMSADYDNLLGESCRYIAIANGDIK